MMQIEMKMLENLLRILLALTESVAVVAGACVGPGPAAPAVGMAIEISVAEGVVKPLELHGWKQ